jgi:hypothetical protein
MCQTQLRADLSLGPKRAFRKKHTQAALEDQLGCVQEGRGQDNLKEHV